MNARRLFVALAAIALLPAALRAQGLEGGAPPPPAEIVHVTEVSPLTLHPGESRDVAIGFHVASPWHVNAHVPHEDFLVPTVLTLPAGGGVSASAIRYPKAKDVTLSFSETPLAVYEGAFEIRFRLTAAPDAKAGTKTLSGELRFQSCNDQVCLPPGTVPVVLQVNVEGAPVAASVVDSAVQVPADTAAGAGSLQGPPSGTGFQTAPPPRGGKASSVASTNLVTRWFDERGSFLAFVFIFLMGLALNLTPCVYPMMGVTVSLFGGQAGAGAALPKAIVYVLGIALMYSTLGVIAALTGGLFGGWLANPWVLAAIGVLLFAMALSMFGVFELQVPPALMSKLGGAAGAGYLGTFLAGLLVGVFAAPCIGPPIIALLAHVGARGDPVFGFWAFFVLSLGLGLPYLVLATSSQALAKMPRSGSWMEWVKHALGVVLLGVAAFYLALAFAPSKLGWIVPIALALGGLYLGFLEPTGRDKPAFRRFKWAFGTAAIVAAALVAFRPAAPSVTWSAYSEAALTNAKAAGKPVVLDFSAEWCVPCHELDDKTFSDAGVIRALDGFTCMKVDLTRFDSPESIALRKQFDIAGVPTIVFLAADGREVTDARIVGFMPPDAFLKHVARARDASSVAARGR